VAAVERANAEQLIGILDELANTTYFRMMEINMEGKCKFWGDQPEKKCNKTLPPVDGDSEDVQGGGGGVCVCMCVCMCVCPCVYTQTNTDTQPQSHSHTHTNTHTRTHTQGCRRRRRRAI
jgi:hypothetical protein